VIWPAIALLEIEHKNSPGWEKGISVMKRSTVQTRLVSLLGLFGFLWREPQESEVSRVQLDSDRGHMKITTSTLIYGAIATLLATGASAHAQNRALPRPNPAGAQDAPWTRPLHKGNIQPPATCTYSFSTGNIFTAPANYMQYCITVNGTFANFQSPAYVEMLNQRATTYEGYGICDTGSGTAVSYYDYGDDGNSGNWGTPTLLTNTTSMVKVERNTSDGVWTLTQTITAVAGPPPYAKMVMALKNNTGITRYPGFLRFAGFSPDQAAAHENWNENYDSTVDSVWGYNSYNDALTNYSDQYGMMLQNIGSPTPIADVLSWQGVAQNTQAGPNPCNLPLTTQTVVNWIGSGYLEYGLSVPAEKTVTLTARYLSF
jgi:hypothetical protein